jgi:hypothetical protein
MIDLKDKPKSGCPVLDATPYKIAVWILFEFIVLAVVVGGLFYCIEPLLYRFLTIQ